MYTSICLYSYGFLKNFSRSAFGDQGIVHFYPPIQKETLRKTLVDFREQNYR